MPGCLQQFINHNGVLYKVYAMGDQVSSAMAQEHKTRSLLTCAFRANNRTVHAVTLTHRNQSYFLCPAVLACCKSHITMLIHCFWTYQSGHSHSSNTWRVVQLHVTERQSIPNLTAEASEGGSLPALIEFDSLKSLPQRDYLQPHYESQQQTSGTRLHLICAMMSWLAMPSRVVS